MKNKEKCTWSVMSLKYRQSAKQFKLSSYYLFFRLHNWLPIRLCYCDLNTVSPSLLFRFIHWPHFPLCYSYWSVRSGQQLLLLLTRSEVWPHDSEFHWCSGWPHRWLVALFIHSLSNQDVGRRKNPWNWMELVHIDSFVWHGLILNTLLWIFMLPCWSMGYHNFNRTYEENRYTRTTL